MHPPADQVDRLRILVDSGIVLSSELSLDALLQRIVETANRLTGARYAALGVIDKSGQGLERLLTTGIDAETHAAIGELPRGRGILGVVIREAKPWRLHDLAEDPRSVGFPRQHPEMKTFLGVPIVLRGVAYGNLYLTEKQSGEDFSEEDEELTQLLAAQAAAIENARLYETSTRGRVGRAGDLRGHLGQARRCRDGRRDARNVRNRGDARPAHRRPRARIAVLSMQDDPRYVRAAFEAGASGYVLKEAVGR